MPDKWDRLSPAAKTFVVCALAEALLFGLLWMAADSALNALLIQGFFGLPSLYFAPGIYKRFKENSQRDGQSKLERP